MSVQGMRVIYIERVHLGWGQPIDELKVLDIIVVIFGNEATFSGYDYLVSRNSVLLFNELYSGPHHSLTFHVSPVYSRVYIVHSSAAHSFTDTIEQT